MRLKLELIFYFNLFDLFDLLNFPINISPPENKIISNHFQSLKSDSEKRRGDESQTQPDRNGRDCVSDSRNCHPRERHGIFQRRSLVCHSPPEFIVPRGFFGSLIVYVFPTILAIKLGVFESVMAKAANYAILIVGIVISMCLGIGTTIFAWYESKL